MSSAIEVLKVMLEIRKKPNLFVSECCKDPFEDRKIAEANAIVEALLALEQKENIVDWAKNELEFWRKRKLEYKDTEKYEDYMEDLALQRIIVYEDILLNLGVKKVGEQK